MKGLTPCAYCKLWVRWRLTCWTVRRRAPAPSTKTLIKQKNDSSEVRQNILSSLGGCEPSVKWTDWCILTLNVFYFLSDFLVAELLIQWGEALQLLKRRSRWKTCALTLVWMSVGVFFVQTDRVCIRSQSVVGKQTFYLSDVSFCINLNTQVKNVSGLRRCGVDPRPFFVLLWNFSVYVFFVYYLFLRTLNALESLLMI